MRFSLISPTFRRPEEVTEFLESLLLQNHDDFEVILGDGTPGDTLRPVLKRFENNGAYPLTIVYEEFLPVSEARNRAAEIAQGDYFVFLDSDCIIPENFLRTVEAYLRKTSLDVFGGPDMAHKDFTVLQKAISYSMTSLFTTGGIRGGKKRVGTYHPRGFNMGIKREAFEAVGGYSDLRCGEDIELSMRLIKAGYRSGLIPGAFVYHKRRTSLKQFFKQVYRFGAARIHIYKRHPEELKLTHAFPLVFSLFMLFAIAGSLAGFLPAQICLAFLAVYFLVIAVHSAVLNKSVVVGCCSVLTSITMLFGYGWGFFRNVWAYYVERKEQGLSL